MKKTKNVTYNYLYNLLFNLTTFFAPFITMPYLSRVLGAEIIGTFGYVNSIVTYVILLCTLGSSIYGQREIAYAGEDQEKRSDVFWQIVKFRIITFGVVGTIYLGISCYSEYAILFFVLFIEVFANTLDITWLFQGLQEFKVVFMRGIVIKALGVALVFAFVKSGNDLVLYAILYSLPLLVGNVLCWIKAREYIEFSSFGGHFSYKDCLYPIFILFIPQIAIDLYTVLDKTMIGILSSSMNEVGYYEQAQNFTRAGTRVITAMGGVMLSHNSAEFSKGNTENVYNNTQKSLIFSIILGMGIIATIICGAKGFILWYLGEGFDKTSIVLQILSPVIVLVGMSNVIGVQCFLALNNQKNYTISVVIGAGVNFIGNLILIRKFDSLGAAIASVLAELFVVVYQISIVYKRVNWQSLLKILFLSIAIGVGAISTSYLSEGYIGLKYDFIVKSGIGCVVYGCIWFIVFKCYRKYKITTSV